MHSTIPVKYCKIPKKNDLEVWVKKNELITTNRKFHSIVGAHHLIEVKISLNASVKHRCETGK